MVIVDIGLQNEGGPMLNSLQYLRAVAALMIVFYHIRPRLVSMGWEGHWPNWLASGVDLFFVLSGFLMWTTTAGKNTSPLEFITRRVQRIVPLYWILTGFVLAVTLVAPSLLSGGVSLAHAAGSFFFVPVPDPVTGASADHLQPILPQGWTLNYEMAFYALFALALLLKPAPRLWGTLAVLAVWGLAEFAMLDPHTIAGFYANSIVVEFGFGIALGALWARGMTGSVTLGAALIMAGIGGVAVTAIFAADMARLWKWGVPAAMIVAGCLTIEARAAVPAWRLPKLLGDASYSIYLSHGLTLTAVALVWKKLHLTHLPAHALFFAILASVTATIAGVVCYLIVEKPIEDRFKAERKRKGNLDAAPAAV
jgi:peptidoglycan/LPS O-acetylase OafA/YrhL